MLKQADVLARIFAQVQWKNSGFHGKGYKNQPAPYICFIVRFRTYRSAKNAPAYDTIIQAMSGIMMETGTLMLRQCALVPLLRISVAVLFIQWNSECTLWPRKEPERGDVDIAMFDATLSFLEHGLMAISRLGSHHNAWEIAIPTWHLWCFRYSG